MSDVLLPSRRVWALSVALVIAALMVLPASAVLAAHSAAAAPGGSSLSVSPAVTPYPLPSSIAGRMNYQAPHVAPLSSVSSVASSLPSGLSGLSPSSLSSSSSSRFPSVPPTGSIPSLTATLAHLNATAAKFPNAAVETAVAREIAQGTLPARVAYLPSLQLLAHPASSPAQVVSPFYNTSPAPMGIADFGLSNTTSYSIYTPSVLGQLALNGYNATAGSLYEDTGAYYWNGLSPNAMVTPWQSGVQLNTVVTNVSYPGNNTGVFWTQNVVDFSANTLQFIDNVWNFSGPNAPMNLSTLYSYNGTVVQEQFYYDLGPTLPLSFPLKIGLYNSVSNVNGRTTVTFGYRVTEGATHYHGIYDTVVFNSEPNLFTPLLTPNYLVDGNTATPLGLLYDAELVFGGPGGGSNSVINSLNGTMGLQYRTGQGWMAAPSAYDYGTNTGETSVGIAGWWNGSTEFINQGPSMLCGLWNTTGGVEDGNVAITVHADPSYTFVFGVPSNSTDANYSYAPSAPNGTATMWLPPTEVGYNFTLFADGFDQANVSLPGMTAGTSVLVSVGLSPHPGVWNAPIYLNGPGQAYDLAFNATGWTSGAYLFQNLSVHLNLTFNHLNDWGYPEFSVFWANEAGWPIAVDNVTQGPNSPNGSTLYYQQFAGTGLVDMPFYSDQFMVWNGMGDTFANLSLFGVYSPIGIPLGGAVALWNTPLAAAESVTSYGASFGIWAASSPDLTVYDISAFHYAVGVTVLASSGVTAVNLTASDNATAALVEGGSFGSYTDLNLSFDAVGVYGLWMNTSSILDAQVRYGSAGAVLFNGTNDSALGVFVSTGSDGVVAFNTTGLALDFLIVSTSYFDFTSSVGAFVYYGNNTSLSNLQAYGTTGFEPSIGAVVFGSNFTDATLVSAAYGGWGLAVVASFSTDVSWVAANSTFSTFTSLGFYALESTAINVSDVNASGGAMGAVIEGSAEFTVANVSSYASWYNYSEGVVVDYSELGSITNVTASYGALGVNVTGSYGVAVTDVLSVYSALGVLIDPSAYVFVTNVSAFGLYTVGVFVSNSSYVWLTNVSANSSASGAYIFGSQFVWQRSTTAAFDSVGVFVEGGSDLFISNTSANSSVGVFAIQTENSWINNTSATDWSVGVVLYETFNVNVLAVTATNPYTTSPWGSYLWFALPPSAVITIDTYRSTVADVRATDYPLGLFDVASTDLGVEGVNATGGYFGVMLNETRFALLSSIETYETVIGLQLNQGAEANVVTGSSFVRSASYGVDIESGDYNVVYNNNFVANNGATGTFNATHIQAFSSSPSNHFNNTAKVGNYWADWHSYNSLGTLNPYYVGSFAWDYYPLGVPEGMFAVTFAASGLAPGTSWSVTLNGDTQTTVGTSLVFAEFPGTYTFTVGSVAGYLATTTGGAVNVTTAAVTVNLGFAELYTVTIQESGLSAGTSWSAVFNGVMVSGTSATHTFSVPAGTYSYTVLGVTGYAVSPSSGTVTVGANYLVPVAFTSTVPPTYTVTIHENGLVAGTTWSATFNGVTASTTDSALNFSVAPGTYAYQIGSVAGYAATPSSGSATVGADYAIVVDFASTAPPTVTVTLTESTLPLGTSWWAIFGGVKQTATTSGPTSTLVFTVPANAVYSYQVGTSSSTYAASVPSGSVAVGGSNYLLNVAFGQVTYEVTFTESGLSSGTVWTVTVNGNAHSTSGASLSLYLPNGSFTYSFGDVSGYTLTVAPGPGTVSGSPMGVAASYSPTTTPSYVPSSTFNTTAAVALGLGVAAILLALVALLRRPRAPAPATPWQEGPQGGSTSGPSESEGSGSSGDR